MGGLSPEERPIIGAEVNKAKEVLKGTDTDAIKSATESLSKVSQEVFTKLYQQAGGQAPEDNNQTDGDTEFHQN